jgi:hypothetical protein
LDSLSLSSPLHTPSMVVFMGSMSSSLVSPNVLPPPCPAPMSAGKHLPRCTGLPDQGGIGLASGEVVGFGTVMHEVPNS